MSATLCVCVKQFRARLDDELTLRVGDKIEVINDDSEYNDGWYMGRNIVSNEVGLYPKSFTHTFVPETHAPATTNSASQTPHDLSTPTFRGHDTASSRFSPVGHNSSRTSSSPSHFANQVSPQLATTTSPFSAVNRVSSNHTSTPSFQPYTPTSNKTMPARPDHSEELPMSEIDKALSELQHDQMVSTKSTPKSEKRLSALGPDMDPSNVLSWTPAQVSSYFAMVLGFDIDIAGKFARHKITGAILFELDLAHLKELDIDSFGTRFEIHREIKKLRDQLPPPHQLDDYSSPGQSQQKSPTNIDMQSNGRYGSMSLLSDQSSLGTNRHGSQKSIDKVTRQNSHMRKIHEQDREDSSYSLVSSLHHGTDKNSRQNSYASMNNDLPDPPRQSGSISLRQLLGKVNLPGPDHAAFPRSPTFFPVADNRHMSETALSPTMPHAARPEINIVPALPAEKRNSACGSPTSYAQLQRSPEPLFASGNTAFRFGAGLAQTKDGAPTNGESTPQLSPYLRHSRHHSQSLSVLVRPSSGLFDAGGHQRRQSSSSDNHKRALSALIRSRPISMFYLPNANVEKSPSRTSGLGKRLSHIFNRNGSEIEFNAESTAYDIDVSSPAADQIPPAKTPKKSSSYSAGQYGSPNPDPLLGSPKKFQSVLYPPNESKPTADERRVNSESQGGSPYAQNPALRLKSLRTTSTQNFKNLTAPKKAKTSAFQEGINNITPTESSKTANFTGWMAKKSGNNLSWRTRYFTLHGTRLSYYTSLKDTKEKGLIDITAHRVLPVNVDNESTILGGDKMIAMYAASAGLGRYCFKIVPPAPGFKKGLTFTQPRLHYFAVDTAEEMRGWMNAIKSATIDMDDDAPKVSSCTTPTISLSKAQEMLAKAREATRHRDEQLASGEYFDADDRTGDSESSPRAIAAVLLDPNSADSLTSDLTEVRRHAPKLEISIPDRSASLFNDTSPSVSSSGFASPYLLASGLLSPRMPSASTEHSAEKHGDSYFVSNTSGASKEAAAIATTPKASKGGFSGVFAKRSGSRTKTEPMIAYSSNGAKNTITPRS